MHFKWYKFLFLLLPICLASEVGYFLPWGEDASLSTVEVLKQSTLEEQKSLGVSAAKVIIEFHQSVISPADGPRSHFRPSSSTYARNAIEKYGFVKGFLLGCDRLMRENNDPWYYPKVTTEEGTYKYDPVP